MDKGPNNGQECGDGWRSRGVDVADRALLVDGETGESFPAQVNSPRQDVTAFVPSVLGLASIHEGGNRQLPLIGCMPG